MICNTTTNAPYMAFKILTSCTRYDLVGSTDRLGTHVTILSDRPIVTNAANVIVISSATALLTGIRTTVRHAAASNSDILFTISVHGYSTVLPDRCVQERNGRVSPCRTCVRLWSGEDVGHYGGWCGKLTCHFTDNVNIHDTFNVLSFYKHIYTTFTTECQQASHQYIYIYQHSMLSSIHCCML